MVQEDPAGLRAWSRRFGIGAGVERAKGGIFHKFQVVDFSIKTEISTTKNDTSNDTSTLTQSDSGLQRRSKALRLNASSGEH